MLLRSTISNTKKFLRKTLESFKSFFSTGYQRLPKTPADFLDVNNNLSSFENLDMFDSDFTHNQWDSENDKAKRRSKKKKKKKNGSFMSCSNASPEQRINQMEITREEQHDNQNSRKSLGHQIKGRQEDSLLSSINTGEQEERAWMQAAEKLKELENKLGMGNNMGYVMDVEEVIHYYSRLTCPAYLQIVDKFLMDICSDFFDPAKPTAVNYFS